MKVIFIGTTGVHHALVAANLLACSGQHMRYSRLEGFGDRKREISGYPLLINDDGRGNQIYTLGAGKDVYLACRAMTQLVDICGFQSSDLWIEPVRIKGDKIFLWLIKFPDLKWLKTVTGIIMERLIESQLKVIVQSVRNVENKYREQLQADSP